MEQKPCCNEKKIETPQTFSNGTVHIKLTCSTCGKHHGYKPQTKGPDRVLEFGKHKGKTLKYVYDNDKTYLVWLMSNSSGGVRLDVKALLDGKSDEYSKESTIDRLFV